MATEQFFQLASTQSEFNKENAASLSKWKSLSDDSEENGINGFDCNICLDTVNDPVVTLCGHLYCWPCIYKWIKYQSTPIENSEKQQPQCPVCKFEVSQQTLVPLYGRGQTTKPSDVKSSDIGLYIPKRPASPRCGVHTTPRPAQQLHRRHYPLPPPPPPQLSFSGDYSMSNALLSPTAQMFREMVYGRIFGNSESLVTYPNSYNVVGMSSARGRRQAMEADRSLSRLCFFFFCCLMLCLLLF